MIRIVSGGQTGVDRGALDAALEADIACGGWCPDGRKAEDGRIPARYPVVELTGSGYPGRTRKNVEDSDGTVIISFGQPSGGTALTARLARDRHRPLLIIDAEKTSEDAAATQAAGFIVNEGIHTLNVAGPRASGASMAHGYARHLVSALITNIGKQTC